LQYVVVAARNIGRHMRDYKVVVNKSTVPVGTVDKVCAAIAEELKDRDLLPSSSGIGVPGGAGVRRRLQP
jgi:UDPglucose 6-dehydrogenase